MNNKTIKEKYLPPTIEVIEMESEESVMTGSNINGYQPGRWSLTQWQGPNNKPILNLTVQ